MSKAKSLRRSLLASAVACVMSLSTFVGTTFAWFTDSVTSTNNLIASGNLDIELEYLKEDGNWATVTEQTNVFQDNALWEPGHTEVVYLKIVNAGSLSFNYKLGVNVEEVGSVNVFDEPFRLSNHIMMGAVEGVETAYASRQEARNAVNKDEVVALSKGYAKEGVLYAVNNVPTTVQDAKSEEYVALVVYMPETVGNEANHKKGAEVPTITLGISLLATQYTYEEDSFDKDYDKDANTTVPPVPVEKKTIPEVNVIDKMNTGLGSNPLYNVEMDAYRFDAKDYSTSHPLETYGNWHADFYVSTNGPVENGIMLIGNYADFGWIGVWAPKNDQKYEPTPLLGSVAQIAWTYADVAKYVQVFYCGIIDKLGNNTGLGVTVELRITNPNDANDFITVRSIPVTL